MLEQLSDISEAVESHPSQLNNLSAEALERAEALWLEVVRWHEDITAPLPTLSPIPSLTTARLKLAECELAKRSR